MTYKNKLEVQESLHYLHNLGKQLQLCTETQILSEVSQTLAWIELEINNLRSYGLTIKTGEKNKPIPF